MHVIAFNTLIPLDIKNVNEPTHLVAKNRWIGLATLPLNTVDRFPGFLRRGFSTSRKPEKMPKTSGEIPKSYTFYLYHFQLVISGRQGLSYIQKADKQHIVLSKTCCMLSECKQKFIVFQWNQLGTIVLYECAIRFTSFFGCLASGCFFKVLFWVSSWQVVDTFCLLPFQKVFIHDQLNGIDSLLSFNKNLFKAFDLIL